jgi:hypothetical protein
VFHCFEKINQRHVMPMVVNVANRKEKPLWVNSFKFVIGVTIYSC